MSFHPRTDLTNLLPQAKSTALILKPVIKAMWTDARHPISL